MSEVFKYNLNDSNTKFNITLSSQPLYFIAYYHCGWFPTMSNIFVYVLNQI